MEAFDGQIWSIGGFVEEKDVWNYDFAGQRKWVNLSAEKKVSLSKGRDRAAAVFVNGKIYIIGGNVAGEESNACASVLIFDIAKMCWSDGPDLKKPRHSHSAITSSWEGRIFVIGGTHGGATASNSVEMLEVANTGNQQWQEITGMLHERFDAATCVYTGLSDGGACIVALGGWSGSPVSWVERLTRGGNGEYVWSEMPSLVQAQNDAIAFQFEEKMFCFSCNKHVPGECFSASTQQWTQLRETPFELKGSGIVTPLIGGNFYACRKRDNKKWCLCSYNPREDKWEETVEGSEWEQGNWSSMVFSKK